MISFITMVDGYVLQSLYALRDPSAVTAFIWVSTLADAITIGGLALALTLWLVLRRKFALAQGVVLSVVASAIAAELFKVIFARARPPMSFWAYTETGYSFPSAHATLAMAFYGFLAFMIWQSDLKPVWRRAAVAVAVAVILLIGFSRLYLGVHYLSDVLGGYVLGAVCLWLAIKTTTMLRSR
jgi:membrane-associated phospholipid phosphatase